MRETIVDRAYAKTLLPPRKEDGHKGDFGKLLVLGGSVGYTGAPYLAASAAVHSGCGLVYLGVPESIWTVEAQKCVSAMPFPLPETDGRLCLAALDKMQDKLKGCDVLALGPGLGRGKETEQLVHALLWQVKEPLVLDADGLNALQGCTEKLDVRRGRVTILTPHDGEFARLTDRDAPGDCIERTGRACEPLCLRARLYLGAQGAPDAHCAAGRADARQHERLLGALKGRERGRADGPDRVAPVSGHGRGGGRGTRRVAPRPRGRASGAGNDRVLCEPTGARDAGTGPRVPGAAGSIKRQRGTRPPHRMIRRPV